MASDPSNQFDDLNYIINIVTFVISCIAVGAFIYRFRLSGLDRSAIIILLTYLIKNAFCIFLTNDLYSVWDYITPIASTVIFGVLLHFVLEMSYIRALIEEETV